MKSYKRKPLSKGCFLQLDIHNLWEVTNGHCCILCIHMCLLCIYTAIWRVNKCVYRTYNQNSDVYRDILWQGLLTNRKYDSVFYKFNGICLYTLRKHFFLSNGKKTRYWKAAGSSVCISCSYWFEYFGTKSEWRNRSQSGGIIYWEASYFYLWESSFCCDTMVCPGNSSGWDFILTESL